MHIEVVRFYSNSKETYSLITVDGKFICFGLEDEFRKEKVYGETRIPEGVYEVGVRTYGGFHSRYTNKFEFHRGMLEILGVPDFTDVLIHIGNKEKDTDGCLLVGSSCDPTKHYIGQSTLAYTRLYNTVIDSALHGELTIEFIDMDDLHIPDSLRILH